MLGGLSIRWNPYWFVPCLFALGHGVLHILPLFLGSKTLLDLLYDLLVIFLRYFVFIIANIKNFSSSIKLLLLIQKKKFLTNFPIKKFCFLGTKQLTFIRTKQNFVISSMYGFIEAHVLPGPYMFTLIVSCFVSTSKTATLNPCLLTLLRASP